MDFSSGIQRLIYFCWKEGVNPAIVKKTNTLIHDGAVSSTRTCQQCVSSFEDSDFNVADNKRNGRPCLNVNDAIQACIDGDKYL